VVTSSGVFLVRSWTLGTLPMLCSVLPLVSCFSAKVGSRWGQGKA
jgi:hypothetical protein